MNAQDFCFWLRGFYELNGETALTKEQSATISKHLTLVFEQKAKDLPPVSTWKPFTLGDTSVGSAVSTVSAIDSLAKAYKDMKKLVQGEEDAYTPPVTVSCRTSPYLDKIC